MSDINMTKEHQERAIVLLKAVEQMFKKQDETIYVQSINEITTFYDGAECDGMCLREDINYLLEEVEDGKD